MKSGAKNGTPVALPLDEEWWLHGESRDWPPDDLPILAPYAQTRPGFELIVAKALEGGPDIDCFPVDKDGYLRVCVWNIWEQKQDPADSDEEKQKINAMQRALGDLSDDDRYIRIQIACLARCFWTFPENVDLILEGVASGQVQLDAGISCEPPWTGMRMVLHHRRSGSAESKKYWFHHVQGRDPMTDPRQKRIRDYLKALMWWSAGGDLSFLKWEIPENADLAETIYRYLGPPNKLKRLYVQKLCWTLGYWAFPSQAAPENRWKGFSEVTEVLDNAVQQALGDEEDVIGKLIDHNNGNGSCHHAFFRHLDYIIAAVGVGRPATLPGAGQERKRIHEKIVNYVHVLGSWLAGRTPEEAVSVWPPCEGTARRLYDLLGNPTPRKRWLVACLWKKLQEDRAHRGRGALDEQPDRFVLPPHALRV